ncbi:piggyBac transposable element-derived protein 1 [Talpa occidentalis]|uniref:piggyBac transposable element-derived protein 1 n=1 Tax=Talpa occidentalis TaxID=50954 RepID=UPI00188E3A67|nr:piggyBac transposable element-derived protein 1 [Talpa occidentalis]
MEAFTGAPPGNAEGLVKVKEEDPAWEQVPSSWGSSAHTRELCRLRFRHFCYQEVTGPREALAQLQELCCQWLRPDTHTKEQILELLVLEQFLSILPGELQAWVPEYPLESGQEVVMALETLETDMGDKAQQASAFARGQEYLGACLEHQRIQLLPGVSTLKCEPPELSRRSPQEVSGPVSPGSAPRQEESARDKAAVPGFNSARCQISVKTEEENAFVPEERPHLSLPQRNLCGSSAWEKLAEPSLMSEEVVTEGGLFNAKQETSEEMEQGAEGSGTFTRECVPQVPGSTPVPPERTPAQVNTLRGRHQGDLWARMHVSSLEYAAGDITRKERRKRQSSEVEEEHSPESQPAHKKRKMAAALEQCWVKRDIKATLPGWSALDTGLLNLKSEKLSPVELFELFFDDETFNLIVSETNNYAFQKNVNLEVTVQEMSFFTSVKLVSILKKKGVKATGIIQENRTEKCPLMDAEQMKNMEKGYFDFQVEENNEIIVCRWHGDGVVSLCSNAVGIEPVSEVSGVTEDIEAPPISRPAIATLYGECREGVAKMEQTVSKYKVRIRSRKWYSVLVNYMIDAAVSNAWQLHRACSPATSLDLLGFRRYVAHFYLGHQAHLSD